MQNDYNIYMPSLKTVRNLMATKAACGVKIGYPTTTAHRNMVQAADRLLTCGINEQQLVYNRNKLKNPNGDPYVWDTYQPKGR